MKGRTWSWVLLAGIWGATAPATAEVRLGTWCALVTTDYHLISDLPEQAQRDLVSRLRRLSPIVEPYLPGTPVSRPSALRIIVFESRGDFRRLTGKRRFAGFMQPTLRTDRLLVGPVRGGLTETIQHEYAHYLLRNRLDVSLPMWFDEGLASVLGTIELEDIEARIGRLPQERMRSRVRGTGGLEQPAAALARTLSATELTRWPASRIEAFYDWSWLLTHYLTFGPGAELADLEAYLASRDRSLTAHLGLSESALLRKLERYTRNPARATRVPSAPAPVQDGSFTCLDDYQRDRELAGAIYIQNPAMARALLEPYLDTQPNDVDLLVMLARAALADELPDVASELAATASGLAPDDARTMILEADLNVYGCLLPIEEGCPERWRAAAPVYRAALKVDPLRFDAILSLGIAYLYTGRPGEAVNYLRVAYSRLPWAAVANYFLGESYRLIGDTRAFGYLSNARHWAEQEIWRRLAEESIALLDAPALPGAGAAPGPAAASDAG